MTGGAQAGDDKDAADVAAVVKACSGLLRPPAEWTPPAGYPDSLALAVIDAIWSIGTRYPVTRGVIGRYRSLRARQHADASHDSLTDLLATYERLGGVDAFIEKVGTRNRVSTRPGAARKGEVVQQAAALLTSLGIDTAANFLGADGTPAGDQAREAWSALPGQGSGTSWRYLRMLLGLPDVKPDRMIIRFVAAALQVEEGSVAAERAVRLVRAAAEHLGVDQRALDHEIWEYQSGQCGSHDPLSDREHLQALAHAFIGAAFPALAELRVIPTSVYNPFVRVGHDYEGTVVMGLPEFKELEAALERRYPQRFARTEGPGLSDSEFALHYVFSFLEAATARCGGGPDTFEADTEAVQKSFDELVAVLEAAGDQLHCCRAVSHLTTETGEPVRIGEITVYPDTGLGSVFKRTRELIPRAGADEPPRIYDPPQSLVVATASSPSSDPYPARREISGLVDRFLLLARLLFAGTHQSCWQITGTPTVVSRMNPHQRTFGKQGMNHRMQRAVRLRDEHAPLFAALSGLLDAASVRQPGVVVSSLQVALSRFDSAHEAHDDYESIVDLATAFEAALISDGAEHDAISLRLRSRAAALLATESDPGHAIFKDVQALYDVRSKLVHGGRITEKYLRKMISGVSTVPDAAPFGVAFAFAVDRLRDLVRRALLARICLATGPEPLWPLDSTESIDAQLADDPQRIRWREHWRNELTAFGAAAAAEAAPHGDSPWTTNQSAKD